MTVEILFTIFLAIPASLGLLLLVALMMPDDNKHVEHKK